MELIGAAVGASRAVLCSGSVSSCSCSCRSVAPLVSRRCPVRLSSFIFFFFIFSFFRFFHFFHFFFFLSFLSFFPFSFFSFFCVFFIIFSFFSFFTFFSFSHFSIFTQKHVSPNFFISFRCHARSSRSLQEKRYQPECVKMAIRDAWNMCALTSEMVHNLQNRTNQRILRRSHGDSRKPRPGRGAGEMVLHVSEAGPNHKGKALRMFIMKKRFVKERMN